MNEQSLQVQTQHGTSWNPIRQLVSTVTRRELIFIYVYRRMMPLTVNQSLSMSKSFDIPWQHHANHATVRFQRWAALGLQIPKTSASTSEMDHLTEFEDPLSFGKRPRMVSLCENWRVCCVLSINGCSMEWAPHHPGIQANPQGGDAPAVISWFISPMNL
jgi:hypothetical protein